MAAGTRLDKRRVLVVGAGTRPSDDPDAPLGNGRAVAVAAAREGAAIACADRDEASARETADLAAAAGGEPVGVVADVTAPQECERMVAEAAVAMGGIDGLVLNVGIALGGGLAGTSADQWDTVFAVNVRAHFLTCRAAQRCR
jgi:NAD(P)-dependent dehydrogenase (short-subunit alcohol dehydrogenase family)